MISFERDEIQQISIGVAPRLENYFQTGEC
jgi:hypothetical protein